jgi:DNA-binding GntR family transcriptional regulator
MESAILPIGRSASVELAEMLREQIFEGILSPGERLVEADLAAKFGVSRGPVRSALGWLDRAGLVSVSPRVGTRVIALNERDVKEIYSLRTALEVLAVQQFATLPVRDVTPITRALGRFAAASARNDDPSILREADLDLHRQICLSSKNARLVAAWGGVRDQICLVIASVQRMQPEVVGPVVHVHSEIVDALVAEDWDQAERAVKSHLTASQAAMAESLAK